MRGRRKVRFRTVRSKQCQTEPVLHARTHSPQAGAKRAQDLAVRVMGRFTQSGSAISNGKRRRGVNLVATSAQCEATP